MKNTSLLETWIKDFTKGQKYPTYTNHCEKFLYYIKTLGKENRPNEIDKNDIIGSVVFYNNLGKINTTNTMAIHLEAIKAFYDKIHREGKTDNIFNDIAGYELFKDEISEKLNLNNSTEREYLPEHIIIKLLEYFEKNYNSNDIDLHMIKLYTKITLLAPAKRKVIAELKFADFDNDFRSVTINEVKILISNSLRRDILSALKLSEKKYLDSTRFFEHIYDRKYNHNVFNKPLYKVLKEIEYDISEKKSKTFSVEKLMNTAIVTMIINNTNPILIAKINDSTLGTIEEKIKKYGIEVGNYSHLINESTAQAYYYKYI
ncbi:type 1 periplasmic-binding domain-containing protein [Helicovermis profundi]|uniref:Uncharacterized protein n=1 Tax=Helicovermis profundi TaxID=3065157 RepID=A0AAU9EBA8_9FIRM|nr:hypothetical protein HLPR_01580 [Clostridia bacterium S502]